MEDYPSNETKAALKRGETLMIAEINRVFDPAVVELAAQAGFGCTWIDMEHSHLDFSALAAMVLAARTVAVDVVVRIPNCLLYTSPSPRDGLLSRMPSSA